MVVLYAEKILQSKNVMIKQLQLNIAIEKMRRRRKMLSMCLNLTQFEIVNWGGWKGLRIGGFGQKFRSDCGFQQ